MRPRLPLRAAFAAQPGVAQSYAHPVSRCTHPTSLLTRQQVRFVGKAPSDPWRALMKDMQLQYMTFKGFEAICAGAQGQGLWKRSTAVEYYECAQAFVAAVQKGSSPGSTHLLDQPRFDAATIYETGCILHARHPSLTPLASAMWASASGLGFQPATITLAGDLVRHGKFGQLPMMRKVESDFRRIVTQGKDANALTIEGLRLYRQEKKLSQAAAMFKKALSVGGPDFSFKSRCENGLGHIAHSQGRLEEAAEYLEKAYEVDPRSAGLLLGDVYASLDPQKARQVYYRTASHGNANAWGRLADLELGMAMDAQDQPTKQEHQLWAMEFQRLGDVQRTEGRTVESL